MCDFDTCPSCGDTPDGQTHNGAPDPKKDGGAEHVCWRCAKAWDGFKAWLAVRYAVDFVVVRCDSISLKRKGITTNVTTTLKGRNKKTMRWLKRRRLNAT